MEDFASIMNVNAEHVQAKGKRFDSIFQKKYECPSGLSIVLTIAEHALAWWCLRLLSLR